MKTELEELGEFAKSIGVPSELVDGLTGRDKPRKIGKLPPRTKAQKSVLKQKKNARKARKKNRGK